MSNVLNRKNFEYLESVNTADYSEEEWLINPDLSAVSGIHKMYWKIENELVLSMTQEEFDTLPNDSHEEYNIIKDQGRMEIKRFRHLILRETDWMFTSDNPDSAKKTQWKIYRQVLRDMTVGGIDPSDVVWPDPPSDELDYQPEFGKLLRKKNKYMKRLKALKKGITLPLDKEEKLDNLSTITTAGILTR